MMGISVVWQCQRCGKILNTSSLAPGLVDSPLGTAVPVELPTGWQVHQRKVYCPCTVIVTEIRNAPRIAA